MIDYKFILEAIMIDVDLSGTFSIIFMAILTSVLSEGLSWLLIYRTESYQIIKKQADKLQKKIEKVKGKIKEGISKSTDKKLQTNETLLKNTQQDMTKVKLKSTLFIGLIMIIFLSSLSTSYQGQVVAKLPFKPFSLLSKISHSGIPGKDLTECSAMFLYILSSLVIRSILQKILGFTTPSLGQMPNWFGNMNK